MKSVISISFASSLLLLNACATQTRVPTGPVTVTITSETATNQLINDVRSATLAAIEKQTPNARPVTVTATLFVVYGGSTGFGRIASYTPDASSSEGSMAGLAFGDFTPDVPRGMPVPSLSPTPWADGFTPTVGGYGMSGGGYLSSSPRRGPITWMRVSYTIKDANGRVIETKQQWQPAVRPRHPIERVFPLLYDSARVADTAAFLASRVAALSH